jgi:hypothetical protein
VTELGGHGFVDPKQQPKREGTTQSKHNNRILRQGPGVRSFEVGGRWTEELMIEEINGNHLTTTVLSILVTSSHQCPASSEELIPRDSAMIFAAHVVP